MNDGVDPFLCSLSYTAVDHVAEAVVSLGVGALLAKVDIESAYRLIPVRPEDRLLQAMQWRDQIYVDPMLPFGLRSVPKIFNAVADALHWYLGQRGITCLFHYLDDFIILAPPQSPCFQQDLSTLLEVCAELGVPIANHKTEGPASCLVFLGIEADRVANKFRLPEDKLCHLQTLLEQWGDRRTCTQRELESLVGLLNHTFKVVRAGRSFLCKMLDLLHSRPPSGQGRGATPIRLNVGFRMDLAWWQCFVKDWNGVSFLSTPSSLPEYTVASDASGQWGCGAWFTNLWFQLPWDKATAAYPITVKELLPILIAGAVWGHTWSGHRVLCLCDKQAVIACLKSRTSRHRGLMHLLHNLVYIDTHFSFSLCPQYIDTHANHLADNLSRNHMFSFLSKVPHTSRAPTPVPLELLLDSWADWTFPQWHH